MNRETVIGIDFGTLSARALLLDIGSGEEISYGVWDYPCGVMTEKLPNGTLLPDDFALQNPKDYLEAMENAVKTAVAAAGSEAGNIIALGIDFTSSTVLPVTADGVPICFFDKFASEPQAWCKLWKHHGAGGEADRLTADTQGQDWLKYYGGKVSSEYLLPKALEILEKAPAVYADADKIVEAGDWLVWQLCGGLCRSNCSAGFKSFWNSETGYPACAAFAADKLAGEPHTVGQSAGHLTEAWAKRLGLPGGIPVSVSVIDAHASMAGCGIAESGKLLMIIGTSTCHLLLDSKKVAIKGINGVVKDGIVDGYYAYEAGQCCVGDGFSWYMENCLPHSYFAEAQRQGKNLHLFLREKAEKLHPGQSGLIALDWLNGVRSPLMDFDLSAVMIGLTLSSKPEEIYRALIESTAFGAKQIVDAFTENGLAVDEIYATGGIASKDAMTMQIYADVLGLPVRIAGGRYSGARGSAIYAAIAAEREQNSEYPMAEAICNLGERGTQIFTPIEENCRIYRQLFEIYRMGFHYFGTEHREIMAMLQNIKRTTEA